MDFSGNPILQKSLNVLMNNMNDVVIITDVDQKCYGLAVVLLILLDTPEKKQ
jgi:hypothetical protein